MSNRRAITAVVGAGLVIVAVVVVILVFGLIPMPQYPSLADSPDPSIPGTVAFVRWESDQPCVYVVPAAGGPERQIVCDRYDLATRPAWSAEGLLVLTDYPNVYVLVDPSTGAEIRRVEAAGPDDFEKSSMRTFDLSQTREDGATIVVTSGPRREGAASLTVRFSDGSTRTLLQPEQAPADYRFDMAQWSPDGNWILVTDSEGRLIIVDARGGDPNPRVLAEGEIWGDNATWFIPGYDLGTVEVPSS